MATISHRRPLPGALTALLLAGFMSPALPAQTLTLLGQQADAGARPLPAPTVAVSPTAAGCTTVEIDYLSHFSPDWVRALIIHHKLNRWRRDEGDNVFTGFELAKV
jgi:hypothetical protein